MQAPDEVSTERLRGARVELSDLDYLIESDSDIRIQRWLGGSIQNEEQSRGRIGRWVQMWSDSGMGFWIFRDGTNEVVGHGGLFPSPREKGETEVGYAIAVAHWGRGYATEITRRSLRSGVQLQLSRIIAITQAGNVASRRVLEKCGMTVEREFASPDGGRSVLYAIEKESLSRAYADDEKSVQA